MPTFAAVNQNPKNMKKFLLALTAAIVLFTGCKKDETPNSNSELEGTTWVYQEGMFGYTWVERVQFFSDSKCTYSYTETRNGRVTDEGVANGTFLFTPPTVKVTVSQDGQTVTMNLTVSENKMTAPGYGGDTDDPYDFIKQ